MADERQLVIDQNLAAIDETLQAISAQVTIAEAKKREQAARLAELEAENETLTAEVTELDGQVDTLTAQNTELQAENTRLEEENTELAGRLEEAEQELANTIFNGIIRIDFPNNTQFNILWLGGSVDQRKLYNRIVDAITYSAPNKRKQGFTGNVLYEFATDAANITTNLNAGFTASKLTSSDIPGYHVIRIGFDPNIVTLNANTITPAGSITLS
jgi:hypothetical protein